MPQSRATTILVLLFIATQLTGVLTAAYAYSTGDKLSEPAGVGERPSMSGAQSIIFLLVGIAISTVAILFLARHNTVWVWKAWFTLATFIALYLFLSIYLNDILAATTSLILTALRTTRPTPIVHNTVEITMYAGIALFLAPLFSVSTAIVLLAIMSAYDIWAVNGTKHMVTVAEFTQEAATFPGLNLSPQQTQAETPRGEEARVEEPSESKKAGVLGGGDILFPLLFSLTVFQAGASVTSLAAAATYAVIITAGATLGLTSLFRLAQDNQYYPALPFLTTGCLTALVVVRAIHTF